MAYFSSATELDEAIETGCEHCIHFNSRNCPVLTAHQLAGPEAYSCGSARPNTDYQLTLYDILEAFWPSDVYAPAHCQMFIASNGE